MVLSPTLSTVTVIPAPGGNLPDQVATARLRVRVRTEQDTVPARTVQVRVSTLASVGEQIIGHEHVYRNPQSGTVIGGLEMSYANENGIVEIPVRAGAEGTTRYLIELGEDDGAIDGQFTTLNGLVAKPGVDIPVGRTANIEFASTFSSPVVINEAWLLANTPSRTVNNVLFAATVTLDYDNAAGDVTFQQCVFAAPTTSTNSLVTANHRFTALYCGFRGSSTACVSGPGGTFDRCVFDAIGRDAVHIQQSGTFFSNLGLPDDYTSTRFLSCVFRRVGILAPAYAIRGTPMRNVTIDHCVFDLSGTGAAVPQSVGSVIAAIRQVTDADGGRGPFIYGSWISGGVNAFVECATGSSGIQAQFFTVRGCRFGSLASYGATGCTYVVNQGTSTSSIGNMDDLSGRLIANATYPAVNTTAGPLYLWTPQVAMTEQPEITWRNAGTGGGTGDPGGGGGTGGGGPILPGVPSTPGTELLYSVQNKIAQPIGGGGGARILRTRQLTEVVQPAEPLPVPGGGSAPPQDPLIVEWTTDSAVMAEGANLVVFAELFNSSGGQPTAGQLIGFNVPITVQYVAIGSATAAQPEDIVVPATINFPPGAAIGSIIIHAVDDTITEGAESFRLRLDSLVGQNQAGESIVQVVPGTAQFHDFIIAASDAPSPAVEVFMGMPTLSINEGGPGTTSIVNVPVRITGNPSAPVIVRTTLTGTATLGVDYQIVNPTVPGIPNAVQFPFQPTTSGATPGDLNVTLRILGDDVVEANETIIGTLTCLSDPSIATVGASNTTTITIVNDDIPSQPPRIGWDETSLTLFEPATSNQVTTRIVELRSTNGFAFQAAGTVFVEVVNIQAQLGTDYEVYWNPPSPGTMNGLIGQVPFAANATSKGIQIRVNHDPTPEGDEVFVLRILPGAGYTVDPLRTELVVTLRDPVQGDTQLFTSRLAAATVPTLVASTVYASDLNPASGFSMIGPAGGTTCQWHPLSYKPDGTPDSVRIWGILPPSGQSIPGGGGAIIVEPGTTATPTPPIDIAAQLAEVVSAGLKLTLNHDVNGETRDFSLPIVNSGTSFETLIDTGNITTQGGGPRLFGRYRVAGRLAAPSPSNVSLDYCTIARVYIDCRADLDVVVMAINWGNYRWAKPDGTFTHYTANPHVDGEVFFKHLWLEGIPAGWAARLLDPDTTRTQYNGANSRVEIIRQLGGTQRHYLPPLRGHIAYIALYKTANVTATLADQVLRQHDNAYAYGALGIDRNDVVGEQGLPVLNYGEGSILFRNRNQEGVPIRFGWGGSEDFAASERNRIRNFVTAGQGDKGLSPGRVGWWNGFDLPEGGAPSGSRVTMSAGTTPGSAQFERNALEMVHLWHRVGGVCWDGKGVSATDEDWCVPVGNTFRTATATWMGIGGQRMGHQHFYVPDYEEGGSGGVATGMLLGPGRKRARGFVQLLQLPLAGDDVVIADGVNPAQTFRFGTGTDTGTLRHVAIATSIGSTLENLKTAIRIAENPSVLALHAFSRQVNFNSCNLIARYAGTTANVAITTTAPNTRIVVDGMSGGSNGTNVRPWNYLVHGTNSSTYAVSGQNRGIDIQTGWHNRGMNVELAYHTFDWPHMSRMHRVTREGWWLHFDPIAYDISTDLMHLATQCLQRYTIDMNSAWFTATGGSAQLISSCVGANLAWILDGQSRRLLREFTVRGFDADRPASVISDYQARAFSVHNGLNCGTWIVVNPFASPSAANPDLSLFSNYTLVGDWPIERGWGWIVAVFARGYAIDPAMRPTLTKDVQRLRLHPGESSAPGIQDRPSWTEMVREVVRVTMHRSGAASSQDKNGTANLYTGPSLADSNFTTRIGRMPGGPQNTPIAGQEQFDNEWYANAIAWHNCYIGTGFYAAMRRVYSWVDRNNAPQPNGWLSSLRMIWRFGLLAMLAARQKMGPVSFMIPTFHLVGAGNPSAEGTPQSVGVFGRFNPDVGAADPETTFRQQGDKVWWWAIDAPVGSLNYYLNQYILWAHHNLRIFNDTEILSIFPGLLGVGGGSTSVGAQATVTSLMAQWDQEIFASERFGEYGDQAHWVVQWARNELGAS